MQLRLERTLTRHESRITELDSQLKGSIRQMQIQNANCMEQQDKINELTRHCDNLIEMIQRLRKCFLSDSNEWEHVEVNKEKTLHRLKTLDFQRRASLLLTVDEEDSV